MREPGCNNPVKFIGPTDEERYRHMRENAEAFIQSMQAMIARYERDGNEDMVSKLKVWCLMPWEAAIRDDDSGDLWPLCEACGEPIKNAAEHVSDGEVDLHRQCDDTP